ncbi:MAG: hypothetical protein HZA93_08025 [Verrucomicrobia bacterium]|nr:hypothetical protein [Verrucomicrobiota bacterium]
MRTILLLVLATGVVFARQPPELAAALQNLREQRSYKWEVINGDPGPVATQQQTRRGTVTAVRQNSSPHIKGTLAASGDAHFLLEWPDGVSLEAFVPADGNPVIRTPEGWMTGAEVLAALAEERARITEPSERYLWLRRADRPLLLRPDQDLAPFLKGAGVSEISGDSYIARARVRPDGWVVAADDEQQPSYAVTFTLNVRRGTLRDYEVRIEGAQTFARAGVQLPVNDTRIVILTYVPVSRIEVPDEVRAKAGAKRSAR